MQCLDQHFTPLNLHLDDTQLLPHLNETSSSQCLGQNVSQLAVSSDMIDVNFAFFNALANVVKLDVNVLATIMVD